MNRESVTVAYWRVMFHSSAGNIDQRGDRFANVNSRVLQPPTLSLDEQNDKPGTLGCALNSHG